MVLPLADEDKPKCYVCHEGFADMQELAEHQKTRHRDSAEHSKERGPTPGDVAVF